jgi:hypothetical protein
MVPRVKLEGSAVRNGSDFSSLGKNHVFLRDLYMSFSVFCFVIHKNGGTSRQTFIDIMSIMDIIDKFNNLDNSYKMPMNILDRSLSLIDRTYKDNIFYFNTHSALYTFIGIFYRLRCFRFLSGTWAGIFAASSLQ